MKRKVIIVGISILFLCTLSVIYIKVLSDLYPEVELTQEELFGDEYQNLKDLDITQDSLMSVTGDPWIEYILDKRTNVKVIELDFSQVTEEGYWGEIYDMETWTSHSYDLKNGKVFVWYEDAENLMELRFDLVSSQSVKLNIDRIIINSHYGLLMHALKQIAFLAILIAMIVAYILLYMEYAGTVRLTYKNRAAAGGTGVAAVFLTGTLHYNIFVYKIAGSILVWMGLVTIVFIGCAIMEVLPIKKAGLVRYIEIVLYAFLQIGILEVLSGIEFDFKNPADGACNVLILMLGIGGIYIISRSAKSAMIVVNILVMVLGIANHFFYQFRGNPLELSDLLMTKTALSVIGNYEFKVNNTMFFCIVLEIGIICFFNLRKRSREKTRRNLQAAVVGAFGMLLILTEYSPSVGYWNMVADTQKLGYLNAFVAYAKRDMKVDKPVGYSEEKVQELLSLYENDNIAGEDRERPNIIVIMNEAFADLPVTYGFETEEDGMPYIHSLTENTVKGSILVSVFGGSTANTEYEFLTGNTLGFLNTGSVPYMQYVKREHESLASELKDLGYQTIAFHPQDPENYNRNIVYPYLGFEEFISYNDDLLYTDSLRGHMTDSADVKNVLDIYENHKGTKPVFIFNVTMQNHGDYNRNQSEVDVTVKPADEELQYTQMMEYLSLIRKSDEAFEELTAYFEQQEEKTIILMFGDHQPGLDIEVYQTLGAEDIETMYTIPFVMWANYDIDEEDGVRTSPNYLRALLLQKAGVELGSYDSFLLECMNEYPAINFMGYYDSEGNYNIMDETQEMNNTLYEYHVLQYGNMFGKSVDQSLY